MCRKKAIVFSGSLHVYAFFIIIILPSFSFLFFPFHSILFISVSTSSFILKRISLIIIISLPDNSKSGITYTNQMAMEQYLQDSVSQNNLSKQDEVAQNKWKSSNVSIDESENDPSGGFDCNICLDIVHDPVVTLCGHLYCWPCIYKWFHHQRSLPEYLDKKSAQCPVCKSEISQKSIVPLYGRGETAQPEEKPMNLGISIPRRPPSPRCNSQTVPPQQPSLRTYQHQPMSIASPGINGVTMTNMINPTSPTTGMLGEIVYERIFGNAHSTLFAYPNSYNLVGFSTQRARRQTMQADRSLGRIWFFLFCCVMLCLLLF